MIVILVIFSKVQYNFNCYIIIDIDNIYSIIEIDSADETFDSAADEVLLDSGNPIKQKQ